MTQAMKEKYVKLVEFLGDVLGYNYEIVLHDITDDGASIAAIANSHISGRTVNSPMTGFALEIMQSKKYLQTDFITNYKASTKLKKKLNGSTFFIKENGKLTGMLCINYDNSEFEKISNEILRLANVLPNEPKLPTTEAVEQLSQDIEEIIESVLKTHDLDISDLKPKNRAECIAKLYENGIFNIKGAISKVAKYLNLSEPSIYRHLQKLSSDSV
ncbi:hypothetical protein LMG7974_01191 [Campylobacter majalis]|uniref:DNA-binding protein n=1 Tax=Campylobacter majalis TaxID=2790656 RepID=A0ABN7K8M3_9BACT|nr:PAS domain-containing protein [Campylobacter majalis]CAD7288879.1 hypothetical protein LMG7974_01191 [Campylobacter majalis]